MAPVHIKRRGETDTQNGRSSTVLYVQSKHNVRKADGAPFRMETKLHHLIYASKEVAHTINNIIKITQDIAGCKKNRSTYCAGW